jgi:hypothetical protein
LKKQKKNQKAKFTKNLKPDNRVTTEGSVLLKLVRHFKKLSFLRAVWNTAATHAQLATVIDIATLFLTVAAFMHTLKVDDKDGKLDGQAYSLAKSSRPALICQMAMNLATSRSVVGMEVGRYSAVDRRPARLQVAASESNAESTYLCP